VGICSAHLIPPMIQIHDIWEGDGQKWVFIGRLP
jgi:hypothetical protein